MNVHLHNETNRSLFRDLVQKCTLDIVVVVETWFDVNTSNKLIGLLLGTDFQWFGKEREEKKRYSRGGIGILVRKGSSQASLVKVYESFEGMWVKVVYGSDTFFVCAVYCPPAGEGEMHDFPPHVLLSLETDCIKFRQVGKVILMGDFNARIGNQFSIIQGRGGPYVFRRTVADESNSRGSDFIKTMNAANMIVINGIDSGGNATFEHDNGKGSSVIDLIVLSDNIVLPGLGEDQILEGKSIVKSDPVSEFSTIPSHTL